MLNLEIGSVVLDGWKVKKQIGEGAYGKVFIVEKTIGKRPFRSALKVISIPPSQDEIKKYYSLGMDEESVKNKVKEYVDEMINEIDTMIELKNHRNIVTIEDYSVTDLSDNDQIEWQIMIRMQLLTSLYDFRNKQPNRQLTRNQVIKLGIELADALAYCKEKELIHRDIKPGNIFVDEEFQTFKLGDFGVAKTVEQTVSAMSVKGTESYMAPEVALGKKKYSANVDIYSLGLVLYELLNENRLPFWPTNTFNISSFDKANAMDRRLKNEPIPDPIHADEQLAKVIQKALAYNPQDRYQSAEELKNDLLSCQQEEIGNPYEPTEEIIPDSEEETIGAWGNETKQDDKTLGSWTTETVDSVEDQDQMDQPETDETPEIVKPETNHQEETPGINKGLIAGIAGVIILAGIIGIAVAMNRKPKSTASATTPTPYIPSHIEEETSETEIPEEIETEEEPVEEITDEEESNQEELNQLIKRTTYHKDSSVSYPIYEFETILNCRSFSGYFTLSDTAEHVDTVWDVYYQDEDNEWQFLDQCDKSDDYRISGEDLLMQALRIKSHNETSHYDLKDEITLTIEEFIPGEDNRVVKTWDGQKTELAKQADFRIEDSWFITPYLFLEEGYYKGFSLDIRQTDAITSLTNEWSLYYLDEMYQKHYLTKSEDYHFEVNLEIPRYMKGIYVKPDKNSSLSKFTERYEKERIDCQLYFHEVYYVEDDSVNQQKGKSVLASDLTMTKFNEDVEIPYEVSNHFGETGKPYLLDNPVMNCQKITVKVYNAEPAYCFFGYLDRNNNLKKFKITEKNENDTSKTIARRYILYGKDNSVEFGIEYTDSVDIYGIYVRPSAGETVLTDSKVEIIEALTK